MKKILFILFGIIGLKHASSAQTAYVELGGPGLASINFDTRFSKQEGGFGGRIGVGGFSIRDNFTNTNSGVIFLPIGVNYLIGKDSKNYFELGGGVTPVFGTGDLAGDNFSSTFGHILFGYRMQPKDGGFVFRAFISPVFGSGFFIPYFGGVSFGYKFSKAKK